jgi:hypothetical protein
LVKDPKVVGPLMRSVWTACAALAEKGNEPGGDYLHRHVLF